MVCIHVYNYVYCIQCGGVQLMASDGDDVMFSGRVPEWMKEMVDADPRANQEVLRVALRKELGGRRKSELQVKLEQVDRRIALVEEEEEELADEKAELKQERARIESQIEKGDTLQEKRLDEVRQTLDEANTPLDPTNPAVKKQAEKVDMTPAELVEKLKDGDGE